MNKARTAKVEELNALAKAGAKLTSAAAGRAEELVALIARRKENIVDAFYDIGLALMEILDRKLYLALGHESFDSLLAKRNLISRTKAFKLIAVVKELPRSAALGMGQERAYALAALAAATPHADTAASIVTKGIRVRGVTRDVLQLSVRAIEHLAKNVRPRRRKRGEALVAEQEAARIAKLFKKRDRAATILVTHRKKHFVATVHVRLDVLGSLLRK